MNRRQPWNTIWTTSIFAVGVFTSLTQPSTAITVNITCKTNTSVPTVMATLAEQGTVKDVTIFSFLHQYFLPENALRNCHDTAKNLQNLYNKDNANYLTSDNLNGQLVVCAVERRGIGCGHESALVLFTLASTTKPSQALYEMLGKDFKEALPPDTRTVSRIYSDIKPRRANWWPFR